MRLGLCRGSAEPDSQWHVVMCCERRLILVIIAWGVHAAANNAAVCVGDFDAGVRSGKGIMLLPDDGVYTGGFSADKWEGEGMYEYPDGSCYVGQWQGGKKHGNGALAVAMHVPCDAASVRMHLQPIIHSLWRSS